MMNKSKPALAGHGRDDNPPSDDDKSQNKGGQNMKRKMFNLAHRVDGESMEKILGLAKSMYPRRKCVAYQLKQLYPGEGKKYSIDYNLTKEEYSSLCNAYHIFN